MKRTARTEGLANAMQTIGAITGCYLTLYPSGNYGFTGMVPAGLKYARLDGTPLTDADVTGIRQCGPGLFRRTICGVSFATIDEALSAAAAIGQVVDATSIARARRPVPS